MSRILRSKTASVPLSQPCAAFSDERPQVDNTGVENASLYTQPEDIVRSPQSRIHGSLTIRRRQWDIYKALSKISPMFSIAAAFVRRRVSVPQRVG